LTIMEPIVTLLSNLPFGCVKYYKHCFLSVHFQDDNSDYGHSLVGGSDWTNIIIPGDAVSADQFHHEKTFMLTDLLSDAQYECLVQAKNRYGWSEPSRIHRFYTHTRHGKLGDDGITDKTLGDFDYHDVPRNLNLLSSNNNFLFDVV
jgi:hypothetical protein